MKPNRDSVSLTTIRHGGASVSLFLTFITNLMLGTRHATDPDHIVALTPV